MLVFQILQEELPNVVDRIMGRVISRLNERITALQSVGGAAKGIAAGGCLVIGTQIGKRKRTLSIEIEDTKVAYLGIRRKEDHEVCSRFGGTHRFACHKFKCFKCGEKGYIDQDCKKDKISFHTHQPGHFQSRYPTLGTKRVYVLTLIVPIEVKVEPQETSGM